MAKRRFSVADGAAPTRRTTPRIPPAANICIAASSNRFPRTASRRNTCASSGSPASKKAQLSAATPLLSAPGKRTQVVAGAVTPGASAGQREARQLSVLDILRGASSSHSASPSSSQHANRQLSPAQSSGAPSPSVAQGCPTAGAGPNADAAWVRHAVLEVTRSIDDGRVKLAGDPWVRPAALTLRAESLRARRSCQGDAVLACEDTQALTLHPSVFVWAPDLLFPGLNIECPSCGSQFSSTRWHTPRLLHGLSSLQAYVTRRHMCCRCAPNGSQARQRCEESC